MSIIAYVGLPGSGKSYSVVEHVVVPALEEGKRVWTNIPLNLEEIAKMGLPIPTIFNTSEIMDNPVFFQEIFDSGATIIIDECWRFWPSGLKANNMVEGHKSFFAEHRHMVGEDGFSTEIALVTQDLSQIAATVRNLTEFTNRTVKLNAVGATTKFRVDIYQGAVTGPKPPESQRLRQIYGSYRPEIYKLYQSQTMSSSSSHGSEGASDKRMNILNSPMLKIGAPIFFVIMIAFVYYGLSGLGDMYGSDDEITEVSSDQQQFQERLKVIHEAPKPKARLVSIMRGAEVTITYNNGQFPWIDYVFQLSKGAFTGSFTLHQLRLMGFEVEPISKCMAVITNASAHYVALCGDSPDKQAPNDIGSQVTGLIPS